MTHCRMALKTMTGFTFILLDSFSKSPDFIKRAKVNQHPGIKEQTHRSFLIMVLLLQKTATGPDNREVQN